MNQSFWQVTQKTNPSFLHSLEEPEPGIQRIIPNPNSVSHYWKVILHPNYCIKATVALQVEMALDLFTLLVWDSSLSSSYKLCRVIFFFSSKLAIWATKYSLNKSSRNLLTEDYLERKTGQELDLKQDLSMRLEINLHSTLKINILSVPAKWKLNMTGMSAVIT